MDVATTPIPLAVVTRRIWLECKRAPERSAYFVPCVYRLNPGVDPERLERVLRETIEAHPALRSVIREENGKPYQVIREAPERMLERSDSWEWAITKPFDLENGPLFRFVLCGDIFVVNGSHVVLDGGSIMLLLEEVGLHYHGQLIPPPGPGPAAWEAHERCYLESPNHAADGAYWDEALGSTNESPQSHER